MKEIERKDMVDKARNMAEELFAYDSMIELLQDVGGDPSIYIKLKEELMEG